MSSGPLQPRLYSTESRRLEPLPPAGARLGIYTCGPTVYDHPHIGNLRTFLFEDLLRRGLEVLGYAVTQVMNVTDIDDKTIRGAGEAGVTLAEYTAPFEASFFAALDALHVERAEHYPKATEHVPEMIALVERLLARGYAYERDGSVYFAIAKDEDYGRLSRVDLESGRRGERVADDEYQKEDARDFVLWKGAKEGEPSWPSPWGPGRPGWHLECSAMAMKYLGETFDIHCGGVDNIFPHHENEIAQSESATGKTFARLWVHAEHLMVDGEKMSKSLGNFYTLKDLLEKGADPRAIRYLFLGTHYRKKLNFTVAALADAAAALERLDGMRFRLAAAPERAGADSPVPAALTELAREFTHALADDLNVPRALGAVFVLTKKVNVAIEEGNLRSGDRDLVLETLADADRVLGVLDPEEWGSRESAAPSDATLPDHEIDRLLEERQTARAEKNFERADQIRDQLAAEGIVIEDTPTGPRWKRQ